jgi:hypothetical protein
MLRWEGILSVPCRLAWSVDPPFEAAASKGREGSLESKARGDGSGAAWTPLTTAVLLSRPVGAAGMQTLWRVSGSGSQAQEHSCCRVLADHVVLVRKRNRQWP